jgi:hypothetical protein
MLKREMNKKGAWEIEELGKIALAIFFLVVLILIAIFLFKGGGGAVLDKIKTLLRFGG